MATTPTNATAIASRGAIVPSPITVSDRTSVAVFGLPWRTLRTFCREHDVPVRRVGRRPLVRVDDVLRALDGTEPGAWSEERMFRMMASGKATR